MKAIRGWHLLVDGFVGRTEALGAENLQRLFDSLVGALDMRYLGEPTFRRVDLDSAKLETDEDEGGYSFIAPITTSHIAIHCWPLRKAFMLDIFSCKEYNTERAMQIVCDLLDVRKYDIRCIERKGPTPPEN